jgi:hypothetical protein
MCDIGVLKGSNSSRLAFVQVNSLRIRLHVELIPCHGSGVIRITWFHRPPSPPLSFFLSSIVSKNVLGV